MSIGRRGWTCGIGAVLAWGASASPAAPIHTPQEWEAAVAGYFGPDFIPLKSHGRLPDQDAFAWEGYRWIEAYLALAQATGNPKYMETAKQAIDYMLAQRDDVRFAAAALDPPYYYAPTYHLFHGIPAKGWRRKTSPAMQVAALIDGRICESIVLWCELARRGFPQYEPAIPGYLERVRETLEMHLPSFHPVGADWSTGKSIYTPDLPAQSFKHWWHSAALAPPASDQPTTFSGYLPLNHTCTFARAMMGHDHLRGTTAYRDKVQGVVNLFLNSLDRSRPDRAVWEYDPLNPRRFDLEDIDHATVTLSLIEEAYLAGGYGIDRTHVDRLVATFHGFYDDATKRVHRYIGGPEKGEPPTEEARFVQAIGFKPWLWLSQFDPTIAAKVRETYTALYADSSSPMILAGWANLIYWESFLAGKAAFGAAALAPASPPSAKAGPAVRP